MIRRARKGNKMSDHKNPVQDEELDQVSGGGAGGTRPIPIDPIRPEPPTHPSGPELPIRMPTHPG